MGADRVSVSDLVVRIGRDRSAHSSYWHLLQKENVSRLSCVPAALYETTHFS